MFKKIFRTVKHEKKKIYDSRIRTLIPLSVKITVLPLRHAKKLR